MTFVRPVLRQPQRLASGGTIPPSTEYFGAEVTKALLESSADPNARDKEGETPLHFAAMHNAQPAVISSLLKAGAGLKARVENRRQSLHLAVAWGNSAAIDALLDAGADAKARDEDEITPWDLAQGNDELKGTDACWRLNDARFT